MNQYINYVPKVTRSFLTIIRWFVTRQNFVIYLNLHFKLKEIIQFTSVTHSCLALCNHMDCSTPGLSVHQPTPHQLPYSNSCPLSQWCHPTISSSVIPLFSRPQSFPASGYFPMSQFFTSGGQNIGVSASASVLPMNTQDWFPLGWTGQISLQSKGLARVFSKNEEMEPKQKHPVVDVTGDRSRARCCKEQYCIEPGMLGPWIKANCKWSNRRWQEWSSTF